LGFKIILKKDDYPQISQLCPDQTYGKIRYCVLIRDNPRNLWIQSGYSADLVGAVGPGQVNL